MLSRKANSKGLFVHLSTYESLEWGAISFSKAKPPPRIVNPKIKGLWGI